ncbi:MAG: hypothetical protein K2Q03_03435 [Sphingobacteriaceae bacterium]|nr:hypothetical protein [Sphingobacteriaceae bacterium]
MELLSNHNLEAKDLATILGELAEEYAQYVMTDENYTGGKKQPQAERYYHLQRVCKWLESIAEKETN